MVLKDVATIEPQQFWAQGVLSMSLGIGISTSTCGYCQHRRNMVPKKLPWAMMAMLRQDRWLPSSVYTRWEATRGANPWGTRDLASSHLHRRFRMPTSGDSGGLPSDTWALQERDWVMKEFKEGNSAAVAVVPARFPRPLRIQGIIKHKKSRN
jgi:hypothetical protein